MSKRPKRRGHHCWCCQSIRPNGRFSGRNRARHLCKECARLGQEELAYRQAARNIDRLLNWDGVITRKHARTFARFLSHHNPRVRAYAIRIKANDAARREAYRQERLDQEADELALERHLDELEGMPMIVEPFDHDTVFDILEDGVDFGPPPDPDENDPAPASTASWTEAQLPSPEAAGEGQGEGLLEP